MFDTELVALTIFVSDDVEEQDLKEVMRLVGEHTPIPFTWEPDSIVIEDSHHFTVTVTVADVDSHRIVKFINSKPGNEARVVTRG